MTLFGDPQAWTDRFVSFDERFLERIALVWPSCCRATGTQPKEDVITINLVGRLLKDPIVRRICHWVEYQFEPFGLTPDGALYSRGKIDLAVLLDQERESYLAYECKRLNVINSGGRSSLATQYVQEGMMRFLTEQYASSLPMGCMLGYTMDGDIAFAFDRIDEAISAHPAIGLVEGPSRLADVQSIRRFRTTHQRQASGDIELRHALLSHK